MTLTSHTSLGRLLSAWPWGAALPVQADDSTPDRLDWGGLRRELDAQGIRFTGDYSGETAYNAHGGYGTARRATRRTSSSACSSIWASFYRFTTTATASSSTINDRRGNSASEEPGGQPPADPGKLPGGLYTRLTELSYERTLFTQALNVKLGYMADGNTSGGLDNRHLLPPMNAGSAGTR